MSGENVSSADNQQETPYYYTGFLTGEGSISIIRATNKKGGSGFYYTPDLTISNSDLSLLKRINREISENKGVISQIKGGYNLSIRGKNKVNIALTFLSKYPPPCGNIIQEKILILKEAISILDRKKGCNKRMKDEVERIEKLRLKLRGIKRNTGSVRDFGIMISNRKRLGYFLSGIVDAEGSMGFRKSKNRLQPYFCILMKEEAVIDLFLTFFGFGNKYFRKSENLYHFETAKKENVLVLSRVFLEKYPIRLYKNKRRLKKIRRILNDYTPNSRQKN